MGTYPGVFDTDWDGVSDFDELNAGTDPRVYDEPPVVSGDKLGNFLMLFTPLFVGATVLLGVGWRYKLRSMWAKQPPRIVAIFSDTLNIMGDEANLELTLENPHDFPVIARIDFEAPPEVKLDRQAIEVEVDEREQINIYATVFALGEHSIKANIEIMNPFSEIKSDQECECQILAREPTMILKIMNKPDIEKSEDDSH